MNLPMIFSNIGRVFKGAAGGGLLFAKKHAPEIMIGTGLAGFGLTIVETVTATNKSNDILRRRDVELSGFCAVDDKDDAEYMKDLENDSKIVKRRARRQLIRTWLPVATTAIGSTALILGGYKVINGRYVATAAAYKAIEEGFNRYRGNVIEEFGENVDWRMAHSIREDELDEVRKQKEDEKVEALKKRRAKRLERTAYTKDFNNAIFDGHSDYWKRYWTPYQAIEHVQQIERELQDELESNGFVFLNKAYERLGMPLTSAGQIVGWIKTPDNLHREKPFRLSLGFANDETPIEEIDRILASKSNEDIWIWITPNCDGVIYQKIDTPFSQRK